MLWITDGKQMKQTSVSSHQIWQKEYPYAPEQIHATTVGPYAPEQILSWSTVVVLQSNLVKGPTVVAWGINFLTLCSVPVLVVVPA